MSKHDPRANARNDMAHTYDTPQDLTLELELAVGNDPTQLEDRDDAVVGSRTLVRRVANVESVEYRGSSKPWYMLIIETSTDEQIPPIDKVLDVTAPDEIRQLLPRTIDGNDAPTVAKKLYFDGEIDDDAHVR